MKSIPTSSPLPFPLARRIYVCAVHHVVHVLVLVSSVGSICARAKSHNNGLTLYYRRKIKPTTASRRWHCILCCATTAGLSSRTTSSRTTSSRSFKYIESVRFMVFSHIEFNLLCVEISCMRLAGTEGMHDGKRLLPLISRIN